MTQKEICTCDEIGKRTGLRNQVLGVRVPPGAPNYGPVAQWNRAKSFYLLGCGFESYQDRHLYRCSSMGERLFVEQNTTDRNRASGPIC